jgi:aminoglycoside 6'-N-acetyltransferase I
MLIRRIEPRDRAEWLRMRNALWPGHSAGEFEVEMQRYLRDPAAAVFVADRGDGHLGGFLEAATRSCADGCSSSPVGYVEGWYVDADLRRQSVGRALIAAAEEWARHMGYSEMGSDCVLDNSVSFRAHLRLGYCEANRLIHFRKGLK